MDDKQSIHVNNNSIFYSFLYKYNFIYIYIHINWNDVAYRVDIWIIYLRVYKHRKALPTKKGGAFVIV